MLTPLIALLIFALVGYVVGSFFVALDAHWSFNLSRKYRDEYLEMQDDPYESRRYGSDFLEEQIQKYSTEMQKESYRLRTCFLWPIVLFESVRKTYYGE